MRKIMGCRLCHWRNTEDQRKGLPIMDSDSPYCPECGRCGLFYYIESKEELLTEISLRTEQKYRELGPVLDDDFYNDEEMKLIKDCGKILVIMLILAIPLIAVILGKV